MKTYFDCWAGVAADLFAQALAGEPRLTESLPKPLAAVLRAGTGFEIMETHKFLGRDRRGREVGIQPFHRTEELGLGRGDHQG